ncbi:hypothetical protein ACLOJK_037139, partial [Asimina triloba]
GSMGQFLPPSSVPYESPPHFSSRKRGNPYSKRHLFGNFPSIITSKLKVGHALSTIYKLEESSSILHPYSNPVAFSASFADRPFFLVSLEMAKEQLVTSEDLDVIRDNYNIPSNIILLPPASHETSQEYHPRHLCLNEYMLRAGVRVPFEFRVAKALLAFHISPTRVTPHSWKVIQAMVWFYERRGCLTDQYLWRELLICRSLQGYMAFSAWDDVKAIDNHPDPTPG